MRRTRGLGRRLRETAVAAAAAGLLAGAAWQPVESGPQNAAAADAVVALSDGAVPALPPDFEAVMGYQPQRVTGPDDEPRLVKDGNGCSSPFGATSFDFSQACGEHDLGYDLLRFATREGEPLGPWARRAVDKRFEQAMHERCDASQHGAGHAACSAVAEVYHGAAAANSWRQGYGNPGQENLGPRLAGAAVVAGAGVAGALRRRPSPESSQ